MALRSKVILNPLSHILFWGLTIYIIYLSRGPTANRDQPLHVFRAISVLPLFGLFYLHSLYLVPRFLMKNERIRYFVGLAISVLGISALCTAIAIYFAGIYGPTPAMIMNMGTDHTQTWRSILHVMGARMVAAAFFVMASLGYGVLRETARMERRLKEQENEHLRTELSFLRSQVNPHFMLNVLNSMVSLARKKSEQLEPALIELAGLMSYMLYESDDEKVRLEEEIDYLRSYINLQLLRFGDDVKVRFDVDQRGPDQLIEPMLLIPLVENAFKHGIGLFGDGRIDIEIRVTERNELSMTVRNKFDAQTEPATEKNGGIGLSNLKKRLNLIYPGKYQLNTQSVDHWFNASLNLQLA